MKLQKICIIGDGLSGLAVAAALQNLNLDIDLYCKKNKFSFGSDNRTTAISDSNLKFIITKILLKKPLYFWPCEKISLFYEGNKKYLNFINFLKEKKKLMYVFKNNLFKKDLIKIIKKTKKIKLINKKVTELNYEKSSIRIKKKFIYYDLIILCTGNNSEFYKKIENNRSIKKDYNQVAITSDIKHNFIIGGASQYFLKQGPMAILPFNKNIFSLVWSIDKNYFYENKKRIKLIIKEKLNSIFNKKFKIKISPIKYFPISLNLKTQYYKKNTLILGEGLHSIHPVAGQGFNLVLRDIDNLYNLIKKNLNLGLAIKDSLILKDFSSNRKSENLFFGIGIDLINEFFKNNKLINPIRGVILENIKNNSYIKKISKKISNKGLQV